jgi:hypothetical protein
MEDVPGSLDPDNLAPEAEVSQLTRCVQVPQPQGEGRRNDHLQNIWQLPYILTEHPKTII